MRTNGRRGSKALISAIILGMAAGCATQKDPTVRQPLTDGEREFAAHNYDQAIADANRAIASQNVDVLAEAYYLRASSEEQRPKQSPAESTADLVLARKDYESAIGQHPGKPVDSRARGGLGNVEFFLEDYPDALENWSSAYNELDNPEWKQWILYRMGECQQRLGRFEDADRTFGEVMREYPGTEVAGFAQSRRGVHGFYVRLGAFSQPDDAEKAREAIIAAGAVPVRMNDKGLIVIRTREVSSYSEAMTLKTSLSVRYPDAQIMP